MGKATRAHHSDELRNVFKYTGIFSNGGNPQFIEDNIFKIIIPVTEQATAQVPCKLPCKTPCKLLEKRKYLDGNDEFGGGLIKLMGTRCFV